MPASMPVPIDAPTFPVEAVTVDSPGGEAITLANTAPLVLIAGVNVLESRELAHRTAETLKKSCAALAMPLIFKASFDKANRSSLTSYRGPGLDVGLDLLEAVRHRYQLAVVTDIHDPAQAEPTAAVADLIQIPAFLARQTDLVLAAARTGKALHIKKPQFLAPQEMSHIIEKCRRAGNERVLLCERGTSFGYNNLVVDMLGVDRMKSLAPVVMDVTHALQRPGGLAHGADGRRQQSLALARAATAVGIAGLFVETHPRPDMAKCDGPCALPLDRVEAFLQQVKAVDRTVKALPVIEIP